METIEKLVAELESPEAIAKLHQVWQVRHKFTEEQLTQHVAAIRAHDKYLNLKWCKKQSKRYQSYLKLKDGGHEAMTFFALWNLDEEIRKSSNSFAHDLWLAISRDDSKTLADVIRRGNIIMHYLKDLQPVMNPKKPKKNKKKR